MNKLKTFFHSFKNSLTDFTYYKKLQHTRFLFSLQYLAFLITLVSLVSVLYALVQFAHNVKPGLAHFEQNYEKIAAGFPETRVITIRKGTLLMNNPEPLVLGGPFEKYKSFLTVDPAAAEEDYDKFSSLLVFNENGILVNDEFIEYPTTLNTTINKNFLERNKEVILKSIQFFNNYLPLLLLFFVLPLTFLFAFFELLAYLFLIAILTAVVWLITRLRRGSLSYETLFKYGMHAMTAVVLFGLIQTFFPQISSQWIMLLYAAYMVGALLSSGNLTPALKEDP